MKHFLEQAFGKSDVTTPKMRSAIREWYDLYYGAPRAGEIPDRTATLIVQKLCRAVFAEYTAQVRGDDPQAVWQQDHLLALDAVRKQAMQEAMIAGECLLKPVPGREGFDFVVVCRDCYAPLGRDSHGNLTDVGTMERLTHAGRRYLLLERRTAGEVGLTIETRLFELNGDALGRETPLDTLPQTAALRPTLLLPGVVGVGLAAVRTPLRNCVDGSADAVSVYAPAVGLLHALARNEQRLEQEFANGASRVFASEDLLREDAWGRPGLRDDLFVGLPDDPANVGVTVYSPTLREGSYLARKQDLLRGCENLLGLKRGLLSEVEAVERTATEITSSQGEYSLTIQDLQEMWTNALRSALALCDALGRAYALCPGTALEPDQIVIDWGDGVLYDRTRTWQEYQAMVNAGWLRPEVALGWYFDMPWGSEAELTEIRERLMPEGTGGEI